MKKIPKSFIRDYLLTALVFVLLGVLFLVYPETSGKIICYIVGGFLCAIGILRVIEYFSTPVSLHEYTLGFVVGLIALGAGIYVLVRPELFATMLPTMFGIALLLDSLIKLQNTLDLLRLHDNKWRLTLAMTVITAMLGIVLLIDPFKAVTAFLKYIGIALIINGVMDVIALLALSQQIKKAQIILETSTDGTALDSDEL